MRVHAGRGLTRAQASRFVSEQSSLDGVVCILVIRYRIPPLAVDMPRWTSNRRDVGPVATAAQATIEWPWERKKEQKSGIYESSGLLRGRSGFVPTVEAPECRVSGCRRILAVTPGDRSRIWGNWLGKYHPGGGWGPVKSCRGQHGVDMRGWAPTLPFELRRGVRITRPCCRLSSPRAGR